MFRIYLRWCLDELVKSRGGALLDQSVSAKSSPEPRQPVSGLSAVAIDSGSRYEVLSDVFRALY
jgi:hypothetical protein